MYFERARNLIRRFQNPAAFRFQCIKLNDKPETRFLQVCFGMRIMSVDASLFDDRK